MAKLTDKAAGHFVCHRAAEEVHARWRGMDRKDADHCRISLCFDSETPGGVDMIQVDIPWKVLEAGATVQQLCAAITQAVMKPEPMNEPPVLMAPPSRSVH